MSTTTRTRRPLQPAQGTFRWLQKPDAQGQGGVIRINGTAYLLTAVREDRMVNKDQPVIGWKLTKADATVYDVHPGEPAWSCDCASRRRASCGVGCSSSARRRRCSRRRRCGGRSRTSCGRRRPRTESRLEAGEEDRERAVSLPRAPEGDPPRSPHRPAGASGR